MGPRPSDFLTSPAGLERRAGLAQGGWFRWSFGSTDRGIEIATIQTHEARAYGQLQQCGFTIIELLIVVAIIGIIAVLAIPNLITAIQRSRQSRTVADIRMISEGVEAYQTDHSFYPVVDNGTVSDLGEHLEIYIRNFNDRDGWGEPVFYDSDGTNYTRDFVRWATRPRICPMWAEPQAPSMRTSFLPMGTSSSGRRARRRTDGLTSSGVGARLGLPASRRHRGR